MPPSPAAALEYWHYMTGRYEIKIRRLRNVSPVDRAKVAYYAATQVRTPYGFTNIPGILWGITRGNLLDRRPFPSVGVICSELYFRACMRIGVLLNNAVDPAYATPAHLSASGLMDDLPVAWVAIS